MRTQCFTVSKPVALELNKLMVIRELLNFLSNVRLFSPSVLFNSYK